MGRPSKLSEAKWAEIGRRLAKGEKAADLARTFKVAKSTISERFGSQIENLKALAEQMVYVDQSMAKLTVSERCSVISIADQLKSIGNNLATAANIGSSNSARLAKLAEQHLDRIESAGGEDLALLPHVAALTKVGNEAASIGVSLVAANKGRENAPDAPAEADGARAKLMGRLGGKV